MKTTTPEVRCDACGLPIPAAMPRAIFVTLRGPTVRYHRLDVCDLACLEQWAHTHRDDPKQGGNYP